ncbi:MAG: copper chaperone PCu(A)C [Gammaproteobacteria bacterium]|nr:MAG: copper chaperone PCu(A)C [Gammaproteobacteria bacterium]
MKKIILASIMMLASISVNAADLVIDNPWVRAAPQNAPATAAFMKIINNSKVDKKLVKASVSNPDNYKVIELHRTLKQDGMMKMIKQEFMPIKAGGELVLQPGSWHIMLIQPKAVPKVGESVKLTLEFDDGSKLDVEAPVKKMKGKMKGMMMKHNMSGEHKKAMPMEKPMKK